MSERHIKLRAILIAAIVIILAFDVFAAAGLIILDNTKAYKNTTTYKNCTVTRMIKHADEKLVAASFGYRTFLVPTKKKYKKGDKITVEEVDTMGYFTNFVLCREWKIKEAKKK